MNTLPFLANVAGAVGAPATSWDVPGIIFLKLLAVVFLVLLNGFFVASEFAIVKVRATQLDALAAPSNGCARLARHVTSHLDSYLSATQLGITLASLGLGWLDEPFLADVIEPFFALAGVSARWRAGAHRRLHRYGRPSRRSPGAATSLPACRQKKRVRAMMQQGKSRRWTCRAS